MFDAMQAFLNLIIMRVDQLERSAGGNIQGEGEYVRGLGFRVA